MKHFFLKIACAIVILATTLIILESTAESGKILKIDFKSPVMENSDGAFSFDLQSLNIGPSNSISLLSYVRAIDAAAADPSIKAIYMTPDNINAGISQMEEIRNALLRFRESGKKIISYSEDFSNATCYLATVANNVVISPTTENYLTGLSSMQYFLKDLIDELGIDVQLVRHGKYKSAGEMFTKNDISPENRKQYEELLNSIWGSWTADIATSRGFTVDQLNGWIDNLELVNPDSLLERGLVDNLMYKDQLEDSICKLFSSDDLSFVRFVNISKYASKLKKGPKKAKIAVIYADGEIVTEGSDEDVVGSDLAKEIRKIRKDNSIKSVVFRVNSPGGSVQASELIKRELDLLKDVKPVIVSFGDYAASGGYWISANANKIFTDNSTLTGSIGCFSLIPSFGDAVRDKMHVNMVSVGTNSHSDMMQGMRKLNESEIGYFQKQIEEVYDDFVSLVSEGRSIEKSFVDSIGQGRVWSGADAIGINLADERGGLIDAIAFAAETVGLSEYRIEERPYVESGIARYFSSDTDLDEDLLSSCNTKYPLLHVKQYFPVLSYSKQLKTPTNMVRLPGIIVIE
jgi:protease IV